MIALATVAAALKAAKSPILTGLAVAGVCLPLGYCHGLSAGRAKADGAAAVATVEVMKVDGDAKEVAAIERRSDDANVAAHKEELIDAVATLPDEMPSSRRVALDLRQRARVEALHASAIGKGIAGSFPSTNGGILSGFLGFAPAAALDRRDVAVARH
ncbi:hypothetical protein BH10PSE12_BH10PSE12_02540 [soil metagenome]